MKINNFPGDLSGISAKKEALAPTDTEKDPLHHTIEPYGNIHASKPTIKRGQE